tara:strand:- start:513 stop:1481 length:969 start_codon:yes stop_codon:yes gene_type:complete
MSFLDNSGDIILDAVLTDTGRFRLAKGDGSFKIVKYAFADDEIDYSKYDKNHASGSAYYDLDILKTPVLEAFTNNTSMMKHKLLSISRTNLLYLPVMRLVNKDSKDAKNALALNTDADDGSEIGANNMYLVAVDKDTEDVLNMRTTGPTAIPGGLINGATLDGPNTIRIDQGLDTTEINKNFPLDPDLRETRFIVEIDNRLGHIADINKTIQTPNFIDDDQIASYSFTLGADNTMMQGLTDLVGVNGHTPIDGPRGTSFFFTVGSSLNLETSTYLFSKLGVQSATWTTDSTNTYHYIDSNVRITGGTTGYSLDIPIRFIKKA